ncbi:flocculation protein FLO11-like isoform X2 [Cimex lectularius]|nr:flocculation protein FLO11-like isoform X2 [Cimex lectularius]
MISIGLLLLATIVKGDISEKLRQGQGFEGRPSNFQGLQPPLFGGAAKAGLPNLKASGVSNIPRIVIPSHHGDENDEDNLDRLCNDPFHSFLCLPVGPRKHRLDGRLRPGAVLPPGMFLSGSNSDFRETKQPLTKGGGLLSDEVDGYQYPKPSNNIPSFSPTSGYNYPTPPPHQQLTQPPKQNSEQGYVYKKPANPLPLPSQQVTTKSPPPGPSYQYLPAVETPNIDMRISSQTIQKPEILPNSFSNTAKTTNNFPQQVPLRKSSSVSTLRTYPTYNYPTTTSRPSTFSTSQRTTSRPSVFTTSRPSVFSTTQRTTPPNLFQTTQRTYTYQKPTFQTTQKTPNFFFQAKSQTFAQPKYPTNRNNLNAPDATNTIKSTSLPATSNQYLPSFNPDAKPTNQFDVSSVPKPSNGYLPAVEGQSTNLQQNVEGTALLADEVVPAPKPLRKHERNHTLEELCNDAFHSFLCKPVTKQRKRIDGRIRPGAKIPPHVLLGAGSADQNYRKLLPNQQRQEGQSFLSTEIDNNERHPGYPYQVPKIFFDSTNVRKEYSFPGQFGNQFFTGAASDSLALAKQFTNRNSVPQNIKPVSNNSSTSKIKNKGYFYPAPSNVEKPSVNKGYNYERPSSTKPQFAETNQLNDAYDNNQTTHKPTENTVVPAASFQTENKGYLYPKPSQTNGYFYPKPAAGPDQATFEYPSSTTTTTTTTTTTLKPEPVPAGTSHDEATGYNYPKPSTSFTLPTTKKPQGYVYNKPAKGREFTLPQFKPTSSSVPFGTRLSKIVKQEELRFRNSKSFQLQESVNDDLPPASQFEILKP